MKKRRSPKEITEILETKKILLDLMSQFNLSTYVIGEEVEDVSSSTVQNIINNKSKYPNLEKMKTIIDYIINTYGTPENLINPDLNIDEEYEKINIFARKTITQKIESIQEELNGISKSISTMIDLIQENSLRQQLILEYITNAKASEVEFLREKINSGFKQKTN